MAHEVSEHVNGRSGVGVPLGEAVPVGVEEHRGLVELASVWQPQRRQRVDPGRWREARVSSEMGRLPSRLRWAWETARDRQRRVAGSGRGPAAAVR